ncbi:TPA: hypothetical protein ACXM51_003222 [Stenotrophomonas maltophilia]
MTASPKPIILVPLLCAVSSLGVVIVLGRSSLFVPHAWLNTARPLIWLGVSALMIAAFALRMHFIKDPKNSFSKHFLPFYRCFTGNGISGTRSGLRRRVVVEQVRRGPALTVLCACESQQQRKWKRSAGDEC